MPSHSAEIPYEHRVAIITLRMLAGYTFKTIATKLNLQQTSANKVYLRAMERTDISLRDSFDAVVKNVRDAPRSGRPSTLPQRNQNDQQKSRKHSKKSRTPERRRTPPTFTTDKS